MTTSPLEPWDDERLAAAFAARAALAGTPVDLASATSAALRTRPTSAPAWRRLLAPAAVVILAIGAVGGVALLGGQRGSHGPVDPSAEPTPSPTPSDEWAGREAMGLPVISVSDAIAIRDGGVDDREIAVGGWFPPIPWIRCGPEIPPVSPVQPFCRDHFTWLTLEREALTRFDSSGMSTRGPVGPAIQIDLDDLDSEWQPPLPATGPAQPVEIAVLGHFDDRRSTFCPADELDSCRDRFIVDRVDWVDGQTLQTSVVGYTVVAGRSFQEAQAVVSAVRPGGTVLSAAHLAGAQLGGIEPTVADRRGGLVQEEALWIVKVLANGVLATYLVVDSTGDLYGMTADGPTLTAPVSAPEPTPGTSPALGLWPPQNAFSVLEFKDDLGRKAFVAVVDESGLLEWVQEGVPDPAIGAGATDGFFRDPSGAHRYRLRWTTTICDRQMTVSIARDVARIVIEHAPRQGCDAMGIGRDLVLQFTTDVDPADVELQVIEPTLLPEAPPEPTTTVVKLDRGDSTESVLVIDHSASLMKARAASRVPVIPDFGGVRIIRADDGGTIVLWNGTLCDRDLWISIEADNGRLPDRIVVHGTRVEPCRMALVRRAVWLDLGPIDVASIVGQLAVGTSD